MADRNTGDAAKNDTKLKNPLLCSTVTGLSIDEFIHKAVLMPVNPTSDTGDASQDPALSSGVHLQRPDQSASDQRNRNPKNEKSILQSQPPKPPDDDFDLAAYYARVHGTQPAPVKSDSAEAFSDVDLDTKSPEEDDRESVSSQTAPSGSMAMDLAQNLSQLPQVLPQVASAVLGSFSNVLNMTRSSPWGSSQHDNFDSVTVGYDRGVESKNFDAFNASRGGEMREVEAIENVENLAPVPLFDRSNFGSVGFTEVDGGSQTMMGSMQGKDKHVSSSNLFRLGTNRKKTYAQVPGLTLGETLLPPTNFPSKPPQIPPPVGVTSHEHPIKQSQFPPSITDASRPNLPYPPDNQSIFNPGQNNVDLNVGFPPLSTGVQSNMLPAPINLNNLELSVGYQPLNTDNIVPDLPSQDIQSSETTHGAVGIQPLNTVDLNADLARGAGYQIRYDSDTNNPYKRLQESPVGLSALRPNVIKSNIAPVNTDTYVSSNFQGTLDGEQLPPSLNTQLSSISAGQVNIQSGLSIVDSGSETAHVPIGDTQNAPLFASVTCPNYAYIPVGANNLGSTENFDNIPYNEVTNANVSLTHATQLENVQQPLFFDPTSFVSSQNVFQQDTIKNALSSQVSIANGDSGISSGVNLPPIPSASISFAESSKTPDITALPPSIPVIPPTASVSGNQFRLGSKKRPQYYSGPVEGAIPVSQNVSKLAPILGIPEPSNIAPEIFNPIGGVVESNDTTQLSADLAFGASYPDNLGQVPTAYFKSGEVEDFGGGNVVQSGIVNQGFTDHDSTGVVSQQNAGINFSLEKLQTAVNLSKIQNVVTSFFDPNYFTDKKKLESEVTPDDEAFSIQTVPPDYGFNIDNQSLKQTPTYYYGGNNQTSYGIDIVNDNQMNQYYYGYGLQSDGSVPNHGWNPDSNVQNNVIPQEFHGNSQVQNEEVSPAVQIDKMVLNNEDMSASNVEDNELNNSSFGYVSQTAAQDSDAVSDSNVSSAGAPPLFFNPASCKPVDLTGNVSKNRPQVFHDGSERLRRAPANYFAKQKKDANMTAPFSNIECLVFNPVAVPAQETVELSSVRNDSKGISTQSITEPLMSVPLYETNFQNSTITSGQTFTPFETEQKENITFFDNNQSTVNPTVSSKANDSILANYEIKQTVFSTGDELKDSMNFNNDIRSFSATGTASFFDTNQSTVNKIVTSEVSNNKNAPNFFDTTKQIKTTEQEDSNVNETSELNSSANISNVSNLGTFRLSPSQIKNFCDPDDTQICVIEPSPKDEVEDDACNASFVDDFGQSTSGKMQYSEFEKDSFDNKNHSVFGTSDLSVSNILADEESRNILEMYSNEGCSSNSASGQSSFFRSAYNVQSTSKSFFDDLRQKNQILPENEDAGYVNQGFNEGVAEEFDDNISMVCNISAGLSSIAEDDLNSDDQNSLESDGEDEKDHVYLSDDFQKDSFVKKTEFEGFNIKTPSVTSETPSLVEEMQSYNLSSTKDNLEIGNKTNESLNEASDSLQNIHLSNVESKESDNKDLESKFSPDSMELCEGSSSSDVKEMKIDGSDGSNRQDGLINDSFEANLPVPQQHMSAFVLVKNFSDEKNESFTAAERNIDVENVDINRIGHENVGFDYVSAEQSTVESGHIDSDDAINKNDTFPVKRQIRISESDRFDYSGNDYIQELRLSESSLSESRIDSFKSDSLNAEIVSFNAHCSYNNPGFTEGNDSVDDTESFAKNVQNLSSNEFEMSIANKDISFISQDMSIASQDLFNTSQDQSNANQDHSNASQDLYFADQNMTDFNQDISLVSQDVMQNFNVATLDNSNNINSDVPIPFFNPFAFGLVKEQPDFVDQPNASNALIQNSQPTKSSDNSFDNLQSSFGNFSKIDDNILDVCQNTSDNYCKNSTRACFQSLPKNNDEFNTITSPQQSFVGSQESRSETTTDGLIQPPITTNNSVIPPEASSVPPVNVFKMAIGQSDSTQPGLFSDVFETKSIQVSEPTVGNLITNTISSNDSAVAPESSSIPAFNMFNMSTATESLSSNNTCDVNSKQDLNRQSEQTSGNLIKPPISSDIIPPKSMSIPGVNVFKMPTGTKSPANILLDNYRKPANLSPSFNQTSNNLGQPSNDATDLPPMYKAPSDILPIVQYPMANQNVSNQYPGNLPPTLMTPNYNSNIRSASPITTNRYPRIASPYQAVSNFNQYPPQIGNLPPTNVFQPVSNVQPSTVNQMQTGSPYFQPSYQGNLPPRGQTPPNVPIGGRMTPNLSQYHGNLPPTNVTQYHGNFPPTSRTKPNLNQFQGNLPPTTQLPPNLTQYQGNLPPMSQTTAIFPTAQIPLNISQNQGMLPPTSQMPSNLPPTGQIPPNISQYQGNFPPRSQTPSKFPPSGQFPVNMIQSQVNLPPANRITSNLPPTSQMVPNSNPFQGNLPPNLPPTNRMAAYSMQTQGNLNQLRGNLPPTSQFPPNVNQYQGNLPPANQFPPNFSQYQGNLPPTNRMAPYAQNCNQYQQPGNTTNQFPTSAAPQGDNLFTMSIDNNNMQAPSYFLS